MVNQVVGGDDEAGETRRISARDGRINPSAVSRPSPGSGGLFPGRQGIWWTSPARWGDVRSITDAAADQQHVGVSVGGSLFGELHGDRCPVVGAGAFGALSARASFPHLHIGLGRQPVQHMPGRLAAAPHGHQRSIDAGTAITWEICWA